MGQESSLITKISPLIDGQVPDYIQADHPIFVQFLRQYYKFLESAQMTITGTVDQVLLETVSTSYITLDGTDRFNSNESNKIVFEDSTGKFQVGETITGGISKATATILVDDDETLYTSANQRFKEGETITGGTSGAISTLVKYRANPVQNIQQLFEYANPDNTVDHFLSAFKDSFMESIPFSLTSGVSKRNLIKQIRDLYAAKGTSEGHKLFFRILLGQEATIDYPEKYMIRSSDGNWAVPIIIRCTSDKPGAVPADMVGKNIIGASSGTTAQIISEYSFQQGTENIVEFTLREDTIKGTGFTISELFTGISETSDIAMQFTIQGIVTKIDVVDGGLLYDKGEIITLDSRAGNGNASAEISEISSGSISEVLVESGGTGYKVGDAIKFTNASVDTNTSSARAFVSVVGGRLSSEETTTSENFLLEDGTKKQLVSPSVLLDGTSLATPAYAPYAVFGIDRRFSDSKSYYYPLFINKLKSQISSVSTGGAIVSVLVTDFGSDYTNGTYYAAIFGDGNNQGTSSGAIIRIVVKENKIVAFGTTIATETTIHRSGTGYTFGNVKLTSGFTFSDAKLTTTSDMGGTGGTILVNPNTTIVQSNQYIFDEFPDIVFWMPSDNQNNAKSTYDSNDYDLFQTLTKTIDDGFQLRQEDGTTGDGLGDRVISEDLDLITDSYGNLSDGIVLETETLTTSEQGELIKVHLGDVGGGYTSLPTTRITTENGLSANLISNTTDIGKIIEIKVIDNGFKYSTAPDTTINTHLILKDVSGVFGIGNTFTNDNGSVVSYNPDTQELVIDSPPIERVKLEQSDTYNDGVQLEGVDESGSGFNINNSAQIETGIDLENEVGQIISDAIDANVFQISLEDDDGGRIEVGIGLEDSLVVRNDVAGRFLLDGKINEADLSLEDATVGLNVFGEQNSGSLISQSNDTFVTDKVIINNSDAVILENSPNSGSFNYLFNEGSGNEIIFNGTDSDSNDAGDSFIIRTFNLDVEKDNIISEEESQKFITHAGGELLLEIEPGNKFIFPDYGQSIKHVNTPNPRLVGESLETIITEDSPDVTTVSTGKILYDQVIFDGDQSDGFGFIVQEDDNKILNEIGNNILLDGTDFLSANINSQLIMENEILGDELALDGTDSTGADAGDEVILEPGANVFNIVGDTITDSGGATATVLTQGTGTTNVTFGTTATRVGKYLNIDSTLSEDIIRIQDSRFYQQFSYEVKVDAAISEYMNELKSSIHPAGFAPFGKIAIATQISAAIGISGVGIGDGVAALFRLVFSVQNNLGMRQDVLSPDGESSLFDGLLIENGVAIGDKLLEETDGDNLQFESGLDISIENSGNAGDGSVNLEEGSGGGRLLVETALGENSIHNRTVSKVTKLSVKPQLVSAKRSYGAPLLSNTLPGSIFFDRPGIQLEIGNRDKSPIIMEDNLVMDGIDIGDRIVYEDYWDNSTDSSVKINEISSISISDLVGLNTVGFTEPAGTLNTNDGGIIFEESSSFDELTLEDFILFDLGADEVRNEVIISENGNQILLENTGRGRFRDNEVSRITVESGSENNAFTTGSDVNIIKLETETDSNGYLLGENIGVGDNSVNIVIESGLRENNKIITEGSLIEFEGDTNQGEIPEENYNNRNIVPFTREARIHTELAVNRISLQDDRETNVFIGQESGTGTGNIIFNGTSAVLDIGENILLDGTDPGKSNDGDKVLINGSVDAVGLENNSLIGLETGTGRLLLVGTDGGSTNAGESLISEHGYLGTGTGIGTGRLALVGTDGSSTNAGEALITESGVIDVGDDIILNSTGGRDDGDRIQFSNTNYNLIPGNEGGFVLLNGTDGSSTNAGDELLLELGTLEFLQQNTLNVSLGVASEDGGLVLPISEISLVGAAQATTFDSNLATYDSTIITFDAV